MISGRTAVKAFSKFSALFPALPWQCSMHNPSSGTSRCSVAVLPVSPVPFICTPPAGGKAPSVPLGASLCSPWEPQVAVPARWCGAHVRVCLPACCAPYRAVFCGSCVWRVCVAVLSLVVRMVEAVRFVLWCRDVPSGVVGWARCNTSVLADRGSAWPRVASLWSLASPKWGFGGKEYRAVLQPPSRLLTLLAFCRGLCPSYHSRTLYVPKPPRRPRRLTSPEKVCTGPRGARIPGCSPVKVIL